VRDYFDLAPYFRTIARWIQYFADGREKVENEARAGRTLTFVTDSSVKRAEALIGEDPTITEAPFTLRSIFGTARIKLVPVRYQKSSVV
jgi:hypothetical protein